MSAKFPLSHAEAMAVVLNREGYVVADYHAKGWYLWAADTGEVYCHNPYHGPDPSGRDHGFRSGDRDHAAKWRKLEIPVS